MSNTLLQALNHLEQLEKAAFVPMPPQASAPVDPAAMAADPNMAAAQAGAGVPAVAAAPGEAVTGAPPSPEAMMAPAAAPSLDPNMMYDLVVQAVRQVMQESGTLPGQAAEQPPAESAEKKPSKSKQLEDRVTALEQFAQSLLTGAPAEAPGMPLDPSMVAGAQQTAAPMSMESGQPATAEGTEPMVAPQPLGPLDPASNSILAQVGPTTNRGKILMKQQRASASGRSDTILKAISRSSVGKRS